MHIEEFIPNQQFKAIENGAVRSTAPSNIALVKYWGKKPHQIPANPSISFTLNNAKTTTTLNYQRKSSKGFSFEVFLEGELKEDFKPKIQQFFQRILAYTPYLETFHFVIQTSNTFPHSSGIASSASGMSALAFCLMQLESALYNGLDADYIKRKASFLARLGSGSACRSIEGGLVVWGQHHSIQGSSDVYGCQFPMEVHTIFKDYQDAILLVDKAEKQVSSSVGHELMHGHPFAEQRFTQANAHMQALIPILKNGDLPGFIKIVESEALTLHAMMMCSDPYFVLMKPETLEIINAIWEFRKTAQIPVCFTLDAGANIHVLYPKLHAKAVNNFIETKLANFCQNRHYLLDAVGTGAESIKI